MKQVILTTTRDEAGQILGIYFKVTRAAFESGKRRAMEAHNAQFHAADCAHTSESVWGTTEAFTALRDEVLAARRGTTEPSAVRKYCRLALTALQGRDLCASINRESAA